jgi:hypothetical protein
VVEGLDLARLRRQELGLGPGLTNGLQRLGQLDLLERKKGRSRVRLLS